ncbi:MAG: nucleotidyl transferase AbiEii/AbiGii toxin family protein [Cyanobacteria bacterium K_Offshore_surface_m2_239]|nr:nucleotidyl transferase AbiEii/AbiGii toxin family protein [Cyanobacteria bacterium K_Offshore_surface_m2_239]
MKTISPAQRGAVEEADQRGLCDLDPSILEKDLLITEVLGMLAAFDWGEIQPVFCGGTSLSKGHGVVRRMSEGRLPQPVAVGPRRLPPHRPWIGPVSPTS